MLNLRKGAYWRLFLFLPYLLASSAHAETICTTDQLDELKRVKYVHDGDTIRLEDGRKVRLIGINTPELAHDNMPPQAFAEEARDALTTAIAAHGNRVGLVYGTERRDHYKRVLAHLFTPDGENLQAQLLLQGMASAIAHPPNTAYSECYTRQEKTARCNGVGIWSRPEQTIIHAADLDADSRGFHLVSGQVDHISQTGKGIWIFMAGLMLAIHNEDLMNFDPTELLALNGKQLTVRGWLQPRSTKQAKKKFRGDSTAQYYMRIRHRSAIEINPPGGTTQC